MSNTDLSFNFSQWSQDTCHDFEKSLAEVFTEKGSPQLREACQYPLKTGGKRIRPLFVMAAAQSFEEYSHQSALCSALSIELIHTYSLVHDDLPCMDDDDERRGKPTVHKVYDEAPALLVGDALLTEAFAVLLPSPHLKESLSVISKAAGIGGMIEGQAFDIGFEGEIRTLEQLIHLHRHKTGALIRASVQLGGIAAQASDVHIKALLQYGDAVGLAFQLADDILDAEEDAQESGPPSFVKLLGKEETKQRAHALCNKAIQACSVFPHPEALIALAQFSVARTH